MNDEFEGQGGSYIIGDSGARELVERTEEAPKAIPEPPAPTEIIAPYEPANADFFTPVAPAEPTTTTE